MMQWLWCAALCTILTQAWLLVFGDHPAQFKAAAIERGYAEYCPTDGEWAWKGECDE